MANFRLILKDNKGRAVMMDIKAVKNLVSGANEKKLIDDYNKLLAEEKAETEKLKIQKKQADKIGKGIEKAEKNKLKKEAEAKDVAND